MGACLGRELFFLIAEQLRLRVKHCQFAVSHHRGGGVERAESGVHVGSCVGSGPTLCLKRMQSALVLSLALPSFDWVCTDLGTVWWVLRSWGRW